MIRLALNNDRLVDYVDIATHARVIMGMQVASVEHLLILKEKAYRDRQASAQGDKDLQDMINVMLASNALDSVQLAKHFFNHQNCMQSFFFSVQSFQALWRALLVLTASAVQTV